MAFGVKATYQKTGGFHLSIKDKSILNLCNALRKESQTKCLYIVLNFLTTMKLSSVHHIYGDPIGGLTILDPFALQEVSYGNIGKYGSIDLFYLPSILLEKFPAVFINSREETPITVRAYSKVLESLKTKHGEVAEHTVTANCYTMVESDILTSMKAHQNKEQYKRFIKQLTDKIVEGKEIRDAEKLRIT
jgi:hypothetical protein